MSFDGSANITLDTDDIGEGSTNQYFTAERVADTVGAMVTSNTETGITVTYDDADNTLDFVIGTLNQNTTGNAATATALQNPRTISGVSLMELQTLPQLVEILVKVLIYTLQMLEQEVLFLLLVI